MAVCLVDGKVDHRDWLVIVEKAKKILRRNKKSRYFRTFGEFLFGSQWNHSKWRSSDWKIQLEDSGVFEAFVVVAGKFGNEHEKEKGNCERNEKGKEAKEK